MTKKEKLKHEVDRIVMLKARSIIIGLSDHVKHLECLRESNSGSIPSTLTNDVITEALSTLNDIEKSLKE